MRFLYIKFISEESRKVHGTPKHLRFKILKALQFHFFSYIRNNIKDKLYILNTVLILSTVVEINDRSFFCAR